MIKEKITYDISDHQRTQRYLDEYYQRNNLPPILPANIMKEVSIPTKINRNFYRSLRKRGRTHYEIMRMIQPERFDQFTKDVYPILPPVYREERAPSLLDRIYNFFF